MEEKLEKMMRLAGNENRYQYTVLIICIIYWMNSNMITVSLPFLENPPDVSYYDSIKNQTVVEPLSYEICAWEGNYTIVNTYGYSWISELDIVCDQVKVGLIGTLTFTGNMLGAVFFSLISKPLGTKTTLSASTVIFMIFLLFAILFPSYSLILVICAICCSAGNFICFSSIVLSEEITSPRLRSTFGNLINFGYAFGGIFNIILYMYVGNWKYIFIVCIVSCFILLALEFFLFYESPRISLHKSAERLFKTLRGIAKFNGRLEHFDTNMQTQEYMELKKYFEDYCIRKAAKRDSIRRSIEKELPYPIETLALDDNENDNHTEGITPISPFEIELVHNKTANDNNTTPSKKKHKTKITAIALLKYKSIRIPFMIINIAWFCSSGIYNGLILGVKSLPGSIYVNGILLYGVEIVAYITSAFLMNNKKIGRRFTIIGGLIGGCIMMLFVVGFIDNDTITVIFYIATNFFLTNVGVTFYTYSLENYPTPIRSLGFGINCAFSNAGGVVVPIAIEMLSPRVIYIVFAVLTGCCTFLFIPMNETVGKPMIETVKELEVMQNGERISSR